MATLFEENWNGSAVDTSTWTLTSGSYSVSSNVLTGVFNMNSSGKKTFTSGANKTIIEFSTNNNVNNLDVSFRIIEQATPANFIGFYCNENYYDQGIRIDFGGSFGSGYTNTGGDTITRQYYRITLEGTSVKIQQGSAYGTFDRELVRTASTTTNGKIFYLQINSDAVSNANFYPIIITDGVYNNGAFFQMF